MELSKEEILKMIKEKELIKSQLELTFNQVTGQIALLKEFLKKTEEKVKE
jgi:hypothetical protein